MIVLKMTLKSRGSIAIDSKVKLKKKISIRTQLINVRSSRGKLEISISSENDVVSKKLFITFFTHEPRLLAAPQCITPVITMVGHLIIWRRLRGIL
jgi:hypothetical protein